MWYCNNVCYQTISFIDNYVCSFIKEWNPTLIDAPPLFISVDSEILLLKELKEKWEAVFWNFYRYWMLLDNVTNNCYIYMKFVCFSSFLLLQAMFPCHDGTHKIITYVFIESEITMYGRSSKSSRSRSCFCSSAMAWPLQNLAYFFVYV